MPIIDADAQECEATWSYLSKAETGFAPVAVKILGENARRLNGS